MGAVDVVDRPPGESAREARKRLKNEKKARRGLYSRDSVRTDFLSGFAAGFTLQARAGGVR